MLYHTISQIESGTVLGGKVIKAKNGAGLWSEVGYSDGIKVDYTVPILISVTDEGVFTASTDKLYASWSATDPESGIAEYLYKIRSSTSTIVDWTSAGMKTEITHTNLNLQHGEIYYFYLKAINGAGISGLFSYGVSDGITVDNSPPIGSITINNGDKYTSSTQVTLTLSADDPESGVTQMQFSNDNTTWTTPETYTTTKEWTLPIGDGTKTLYVKYKNDAGGWSGVYSDTIILETTPPTGNITINNGDTYTSSTQVTLTLSAEDLESGVTQMQFSNDNTNWSTPETYETTKEWTLTTAVGTKTVYVKYKNGTDLWSSVYSDTILLEDNTPPEMLYLRNIRNRYLMWLGKDREDGYKIKYSYRIDEGKWSNPTKDIQIKISQISKGLQSGIHTFHIKAIDSKLAESAIKSAKFKVK